MIISFWRKSLILKFLKDDAFTTSSGKQFHLLTTSKNKKVFDDKSNSNTVFFCLKA